jgi:hypothetical protein
MTLEWLNLTLGAILGIVGDWQIGARLRKLSAHRLLRKKYGYLAGDYANYRVKDDGAQEPTGGRIRLIGQSDGSFKAQGLHENGVAEWESVIWMSLEFEGTGTGLYRYIGAEDSGTQQVTYWPETRSFTVMATNTTRSGRKPYVHHWRRIESSVTQFSRNR